ncbi:hypothetical protein AB990_08380 [Alkalihalobacillus pseudalcaliphilus]|nr:hypothetical protein AB990_08380 [Alkalihalobacillus pseudalcaliphilus]
MMSEQQEDTVLLEEDAIEAMQKNKVEAKSQTNQRKSEFLLHKTPYLIFGLALALLFAYLLFFQ